MMSPFKNHPGLSNPAVQRVAKPNSVFSQNKNTTQVMNMNNNTLVNVVKDTSNRDLRTASQTNSNPAIMGRLSSQGLQAVDRDVS